MKTQTSIILSIPQPCHESWNEMTSVDKGRFCQQCQKTLADFSTLSDAQLIELLKSKQASACGRFTTDQLNRMISTPVSGKHRKPFVSIAAIVTALTITVPFVKLAASPNKMQQITDNEKEPVTYHLTLADSTRFVTGIVKADRDGLPLEGAVVRIKDRPVGTVTDQSGKFKLRVPDNLKKKMMILEVSFIGFERKRIKVVLKEDIQLPDIRLQDPKPIYCY